MAVRGVISMPSDVREYSCQLRLFSIQTLSFRFESRVWGPANSLPQTGEHP
jgi:hypothetical protein